MQKLDFGFQVKSDDLDEDGSFRGYGSVFDVVDSYRDVVEKGAFQKTLKAHKEKGSMPALLWQHDPTQPIGVYTLMREDDTGLYVEGKLALLTKQGREAYELLKMGALNGLSIGFNIPKGGQEWDDEKGVNFIREVDLWETSVVTFPANEAAQIAQVRAQELQRMKSSEKEFERTLRDALGLSKREAAAVVCHGFKGLAGRRDDDSGEPKGDVDLEGIKNLTAMFKGN